MGNGDSVAGVGEELETQSEKCAGGEERGSESRRVRVRPGIGVCRSGLSLTLLELGFLTGVVEVIMNESIPSQRQVTRIKEVIKDRPGEERGKRKSQREEVVDERREKIGSRLNKSSYPVTSTQKLRDIPHTSNDQLDLINEFKIISIT